MGHDNIERRAGVRFFHDRLPPPRPVYTRPIRGMVMGAPTGARREGDATSASRPDLTEEEHGRAAFAGPVSHLYRTIPATAWVDVDGPLRPSAFDLNLLSGDRRPRVLLERRPAGPRRPRGADAAPYAYRNADGDEIAFVHHGSGVLQTDYGPLPYDAGDYLVSRRAPCTAGCRAAVSRSCCHRVGGGGDDAGLRADGAARRRRPRGAGHAGAVGRAARRLDRRR